MTTPSKIPSDEEFNAACAVIIARGGRVELPNSQETFVTVIDLWRKHGGIGTLAQFRDRLHHPRCPQFQRHVGASGRMTTLRPTPELLAFLRQPSQPGKRLK
jgi:hypothetical protein